MNKQRKALITITYNEMGIIIDTKAEELDSSAQPDPCADAVSREDAIDAVGLGDSVRRIKDRIAKLPPAKPVRDCGGCRFKFLPERKEDTEIAH